jgi:polysaccharide export outer membrane protein
MLRISELTLLLFIGLIFFCSSCKTPSLFNDGPIPESTMQEFVLMNPVEPTLSPGDKISVSIWGHEDLSIGSINSPYMTDEETGRWVILDKEGEVNLPKVGRVNLAGYNVKEAAYFLEELYAKHVQNPVVNVRVLNHYVTILGEVNKPGKYRIDNEEVNLIELLGEAEGYTLYAKMDEVQLIREVNGKVVKFPIDFTGLGSLNTGNAVLNPDDIIYIPAIKRKSSDEVLKRAIPIASIATGIALIISAFATN